MRIRLFSVLIAALLVLGASAFTPAGAANSVSPGLNWAGYVVDSPNVTAVSTDFIVPTVQAVTPGFVAEWAGIGGYTSNDLIQAGAGQEYIPGSGVRYFAWWETLPDAETEIANPVAPGDHMRVSITNTSGNAWTIQIADSTKGWTFSKSVTYASTKSSAEWIVEAPQVGLSALPLGAQTAPPLMGSAVFDGSGNTATVNGVTRLIGSWDLVQLIVDDATLAPSAIDSTGDGFAVCEYGATCSPPA